MSFTFERNKSWIFGLGPGQWERTICNQASKVSKTSGSSKINISTDEIYHKNHNWTTWTNFIYSQSRKGICNKWGHRIDLFTGKSSQLQLGKWFSLIMRPFFLWLELLEIVKAYSGRWRDIWWPWPYDLKCFQALQHCNPANILSPLSFSEEDSNRYGQEPESRHHHVVTSNFTLGTIMLIIQDEELLQFHTQMVDIMLKTSYFPCWWCIGSKWWLRKNLVIIGWRMDDLFIWCGF